MVDQHYGDKTSFEYLNSVSHSGAIKMSGFNVINPGDNTKVDVSEWDYAFIDRTDPMDIKRKIVNFQPKTILDENLGDFQTFWYANSNGTITQQTTKDVLPAEIMSGLKSLAFVTNKFGGIITGSFTVPQVAHSTSVDEQIVLSISGVKILAGGIVRPNGNNLLLDITEETLLLEVGGGLVATPETPNNAVVSAVSPIPTGQLVKTFLDPSRQPVFEFSDNQIKPLKFEKDGDGILIDVPNQKYTRQVFFQGSGPFTLIYFGTKDYPSLDGAMTLTETTFRESEDNDLVAIEGFLGVRQDVTDLVSAEASGFFAIQRQTTRLEP